MPSWIQKFNLCFVHSKTPNMPRRKGTPCNNPNKYKAEVELIIETDHINRDEMVSLQVLPCNT